MESTSPGTGQSTPLVSAGELPAAIPGDLAATPPLTDPALLINRELSWLDFNERVLAQATGGDHPPLDRVRFLAIVATNLEEFFMIRVAALLRKSRAGLDDLSPDGLSTAELLRLVRKRAADMLKRQAACWNDVLRPLLGSHGIRFLDPPDYTPAITDYLQGYFSREVFPALTPLAFDPGHPFPFISSLSDNLAVAVKHAGKTRFARVKVPDALPRFVPIPRRYAPHGDATFVYLEDIIRANLQALFPGTQVRGSHMFRVVRDADMVIEEDEADDLLESVDQGLKQRRRGALSMLQVEATTPKRVLDTLIENFEIEDENVYRTKDRLGFTDWVQLSSLPRPELRHPPFLPIPLWPLDFGDEIFNELRLRDILVHHPFQSFTAIEAFLRAAVADPHVIAIKMTLYRIGTNSPLIDLLTEAAEAGKQVAVLVELKARFDEHNNIKWANRLEAAGVHVAYGLLSLKTHAKLCLVVRKEADGIRRYVHVGTGNYNPDTARAYTDLGLFTAHPEIVDDASDLFNYLTGYSNRKDYRQLLVAPLSLRPGLTALIDHEISEAREGREARICIKVNALTDTEIIRALYRASQAGVRVDLIVRGVCCLRPGIPGVSDRIRVRSIVGRFLEHSRIFSFHSGGASRVFIGSADLMERNLDRRVEVLCPVHDRRLADHLEQVVLSAGLSDVTRAWVLAPDGRYQRVDQTDADEAAIDSQAFLLEWHAAEARQPD